MTRPTRKAAAKAPKYTADSPSASEDEGGRTASSSKPSTRRRKRTADEEDDAWSHDDDSDAPAAKKARKASSASKSKGKGKGRGRAGKLQSFQAMPLDILAEIARHLDPITLLHMSRANKMMHSVFASRSAAPIWAIARENVYLPDLEAPDMTDMQLASLIWERECHICGRGRAVIVDYCIRKRWCKNCQRDNLIHASRARTRIENLHPQALACSTFTTHSVSGYNYMKKHYYCQIDVEAVSKELWEYDDAVKDARGKEAAEAAKQAKANYLDLRRTIVKAAVKDGDVLLNWERSSAQNRRDADLKARKARREAIEAKLLELGFDKLDLPGTYIHARSLIDKPTALTETSWNKISSKVIAAAETSKKYRLEREKLERMRSRREALKPRYDALLLSQTAGEDHDTFPSFDIFVSLPVVEPFWVPDDQTFTDDEWNAAIPTFSDDVDRARRAIKVGYARRVVETLAKAGKPVDKVLADKFVAPEWPRSESLQDKIESSYLFGSFSVARTNFDDSASTVTDAEFDSLFSNAIARFHCGAYSCIARHRFPHAHAHARGHDFSGLASPVALIPPLVQQQLAVLDRLGIPDDGSAEDELDKRGAIFSCHHCFEARRSVQHNWFLGAPVTSVRNTGLTWSEIRQHTDHYHFEMYRATYSYDSKVMPEIRIIGEEYAATPPPEPKPVPGASVGADLASQGPDSDEQAAFDEAVAA
ncbi:F-box protein [Rhodotorula paludigena]|uniref:F-box protein n=1 Tax=Rhodotorula paludigena TaxID=86838 RepID=UPI003182171C